MKTLFYTLSLIAVMLILVPEASALMSSSNYRLYGDAVGTSGGRGTSTNYIAETSAGEAGTFQGSSTNYTLLSGFQALQEHPTFTFSISSSSIALGTLSDSSVSSDTHTITTSTNAPYGYTTTVIEDDDLSASGSDIDDVADGEVTAGSEEYGIALTGTDRAFSDDQALSATPLAVATRTNWVNGSAITVTYKASIASGTTSGSYSHNVTYVSTGNF